MNGGRPLPRPLCGGCGWPIADHGYNGGDGDGCPGKLPDMVTRKKASGANIPEAQRGTIQVKLRLPPDVADDLDELARRWNLTRSGAVARLVESATDVQSEGQEK